MSAPAQLPNRSVQLDSAAWADRCRYWFNAITQPKRSGPPKRHSHEPLILTGHGMRLCVHHGALVVRNGFTHYPQAPEEHRFFPGDRRLPSRIIVIDGSGSLSFDVMTWLSEQRVPLVKLDWRGNVVSVIGSNNAADPKRFALQLSATRGRKAVDIAVGLIRQKIANSIITLKTEIPDGAARKFALDKIEQEALTIKHRPPKTISGLLGLEGRVAYAYFKAWQELPLRWNGTKRRAISDDWRKFGQRQSFARKKGRNRNASHPMNAILNYAYAVLESQIRIQVLAQGYDPTIGFLHAYMADRPAFVLDLMEPLRPVVDRKVLEFVRTHTFHPADFIIRADGVCRLNQEMVRAIVRTVASVEIIADRKALTFKK